MHHPAHSQADTTSLAAPKPAASASGPLTRIHVRPPATLMETALTTVGILASARDAGLPEPTTVTIDRTAPPRITLLIHADSPAAARAALQTWAARHGSDTSTEPATLDAHAEFTRTGIRVRAIIKDNPGTGTAQAPDSPRT
jgi:hypothetical protein